MRATQRYFAYGSNMSSARLARRGVRVRTLGPARCDGLRLVFDKPGRDGSGKANLVSCHGARTWGVLYEIEPADWRALDRHEAGYQRRSCLVYSSDGQRLPARTYRYPGGAGRPQQCPFDWYLDLLVDGAREHGISEAYVATLRRVAVRSEPRLR